MLPQTYPPLVGKKVELDVNLSSWAIKHSLGSACVTLIVCGFTPLAETVIVAVRSPFEVLAAATAVIVPLFEPDVGLNVSQSADDVAVQLVLLLTVISLLPPSAM